VTQGPQPQPDWLGWVARLQAIAQAGLELTDGVYDRERYAALRALATEIAAAHLELPTLGERLRLEELLARRGGEVLLVRERADGRWSLPGGWADVGWSPSAMVEREVTEESGFVVRARRLLALWDRSRHNPGPYPHSVYKVAVACDLLGGSARPSIETLEVGWFPPGALPELSTGRITAAQIHRLVELDERPELPPDLD
jgi:ADP-ribose pyrophosphatase YjhB (NUDIX family)